LVKYLVLPFSWAVAPHTGSRQAKCQGVEDQAQVMAGAGQQGVASVSGEAVLVKLSFGFHVLDSGLDGRSSLQLTLHLRRQAAFVSR